MIHITIILPLSSTYYYYILLLSPHLLKNNILLLSSTYYYYIVIILLSYLSLSTKYPFIIPSFDLASYSIFFVFICLF